VGHLIMTPSFYSAWLQWFNHWPAILDDQDHPGKGQWFS
jgi:hypothetical protein